MKKYLIFIFLIMDLTFSLLLFAGCEKCRIDSDEKAVNEAMARNSKFLAKKYRINPVGITVAMPGGNIQYLELEFQIRGHIEKQEIRKLLIDLAHDFLADLNSDSELCSYLDNNSLTIGNIGIGLFLLDSSGRDIYDPDIGIAEISKGRLTYLTLLPTDSSPVKTSQKESYEETLVIINTQK